jgi:hypothetical protein
LRTVCSGPGLMCYHRQARRRVALPRQQVRTTREPPPLDAGPDADEEVEWGGNCGGFGAWEEEFAAT